MKIIRVNVRNNVPHPAKSFISGRNFHNIRSKLDKNRIVDGVNKNTKSVVVFYILIDNRITINIF